jgi:hypothetical protein
MSIKTRLDAAKASWAKLTPRKKLIVAGGAAVLVLLAAAGSQGGRADDSYSGGYHNGGYQGEQQPSGYSGGDGPAGGYQSAGYPNGTVADGGAHDAGGGDADPNGYWARQRSQDQQAQAFGGYINDTTTVKDNNGDIHTDVPNQQADPAIAAGEATQVPTAELPTSTPEPTQPSE